MLTRIALIAAAAALITSAAFAQTPPPQGQRVAGTVKSVSADHLVLTTAQGEVDVAVTPQTRVLMREAAKTEAIKPGAYLGTSNQTSADGASGTATEVHLMADGPNVHYPMNGAGLMMTNGHVKSVATTAKGLEMDVDYGKGTTRHVVVTKDTSTTQMVDLGLTGLKPGVAVTANTAPGPDGKPVASFIVLQAPAAP
jgi:hypothetical protein